MKTRLLWVIVLCAGVLCAGLLAFARPSAAAYLTGADLVRSCQSEHSSDILACMNYVAGVIDYQTMMQSLGTAPTTDFCLPDDLPIEQAAFAVMDYIQKNPQMGSFIAAPTVGMALSEAYPCGPMRVKKKKRK